MTTHKKPENGTAGKRRTMKNSMTTAIAAIITAAVTAAGIIVGCSPTGPREFDDKLLLELAGGDSAKAPPSKRQLDIEFYHTETDEQPLVRITIDSGTAIGTNRFPPNPEKEGVAFDGWFDQSWRVQYDEHTIITRHTSLYAMWQDTTSTGGAEFRVTFLTDSDTMEVITIDSGRVMGSRFPNDPQKAGHRLDGWSDEAGVGYNAQKPITGDVTLFARWIRVFEVTFNSDGAVVLVHSVDSGSIISDFPANPSKAGHTFTGWFDGQDKLYEPSDPSIIIGDVLLTARFVPISGGRKQFDVTFMGGAEHNFLGTIKVDSGSVIAIERFPADTVRAGYTFKGWFSQPDSTQYTTATPIIKDVTLIARFEMEGSVADLIITNINQLEAFADRVNNGESFEGKTVTLAADIDLTGYSRNWGFPSGGGTMTGWAPIGYDSTKKFKGTFDGAGHRIFNWSIGYTNLHPEQVALSGFAFGLFGYVEGGTIKNLGVERIDFHSAFRNVGGIVGHIVNGFVDSCYTTTPPGGTPIRGSMNVGGIAGYVENSSVTNCYSTADIHEGYNGNIGGIAGVVTNHSIVDNCYSTGEIRILSEYDANRGIGGIAGSVTTNSLVKNSYSAVNVNGLSNTGGIAGRVESNGTVTNCYSIGNVVSGSNNAGGIVGLLLDGTISNCYSTGTVSAGNNGAGGIAGVIMGSGTVEFCYSTGRISGENFIGGIAGSIMNAGGSVKSCLALNRRIGDTDRLSTLGRIVGDSNNGQLEQNYGLYSLTNPHMNGGTANDKNGGDIIDVTGPPWSAYTDSWNGDTWIIPIIMIYVGEPLPTLKSAPGTQDPRLPPMAQ